MALRTVTLYLQALTMRICSTDEPTVAQQAGTALWLLAKGWVAPVLRHRPSAAAADVSPAATAAHWNVSTQRRHWPECSSSKAVLISAARRE